MSDIFSGLILGVLGSYVANHVDRGGQELARVIQERLRRGGLPPNHDVEQACLNALQQSLEMFAEADNRRSTRPKSLLEAIANRRDEDGRLKPVLEWWHTKEGQWFDELLQEIRADDLERRFDLRVTTQPAALQSAAAALRQPGDTADVAGRFHAAVLDWLERRVQSGRKPEFVDDWIQSGWPLSDDTPESRITLY
jgi:hypothetical protein